MRGRCFSRFARVATQKCLHAAAAPPPGPPLPPHAAAAAPHGVQLGTPTSSWCSHSSCNGRTREGLFLFPREHLLLKASPFLPYNSSIPANANRSSGDNTGSRRNTSSSSSKRKTTRVTTSSSSNRSSIGWSASSNTSRSIISTSRSGTTSSSSSVSSSSSASSSITSSGSNSSGATSNNRSLTSCSCWRSDSSSRWGTYHNSSVHAPSARVMSPDPFCTFASAAPRPGAAATFSSRTNRRSSAAFRKDNTCSISSLRRLLPAAGAASTRSGAPQGPAVPASTDLASPPLPLLQQAQQEIRAAGSLHEALNERMIEAYAGEVAQQLKKTAKKFHPFFRAVEGVERLLLAAEAQVLVGDPLLTQISPARSAKFCVPLPNEHLPPFQRLLFKSFRKHRQYSDVAWRFLHLILERTEAEHLHVAFALPPGFNGRFYFFLLHLWLLHKRLCYGVNRNREVEKQRRQLLQHTRAALLTQQAKAAAAAAAAAASVPDASLTPGAAAADGNPAAAASGERGDGRRPLSMLTSGAAAAMTAGGSPERRAAAGQDGEAAAAAGATAAGATAAGTTEAGTTAAAGTATARAAATDAVGGRRRNSASEREEATGNGACGVVTVGQGRVSFAAAAAAAGLDTERSAAAVGAQQTAAAARHLAEKLQMKLHALEKEDAFLVDKQHAVEGEMLDDALFNFTWDVVKDWLKQKKVQEARFEVELRNCQEHAYGFFAALDEALTDEQIYASRVKEALWGNLYSGRVSYADTHLQLLTKYTLRQLTHLMHLPKEHFYKAYFTWADFYCSPAAATPRVVPPLSQRVQYGGYTPEIAGAALPLLSIGGKRLPTQLPPQAGATQGGLLRQLQDFLESVLVKIQNQNKPAS